MSILTRALRYIVKLHFKKYPCAAYTFYDCKNKIEYRIEQNTDSAYFKYLQNNWRAET